jgi:DNA polymerase V
MDASLKYKDGKKIAYWLKDHDGWTVKILRIRRDGFYLEPTDPHDSSQFVYKITKYDTPLGMVSWILYKEYHAKVGMFRHGFFPESKEEEVNLEKLLIPRASSTFCAKAGGDSMNDERITNGDILVVDKSLEYLEKKKIVYWLNDYNGFTVKILKISPSGNYLVPANKELYQNFEYKIQEYDKPWGMVTWNLHNEYRKGRNV